MRKILLLSTFSFAILTGCSGPTGRPAKVYQAGEKAAVDKLSYAVIDTQIHTRLGDEANPRIPQHRYYTVQIAVSSGASSDTPIPSLTLVDDSGKTYSELADGSGLQNWLGIVRRVSPAQTERGEILFDAPAAHYKLKLTDETDEGDVYIDIPLNFVHEQMGNAGNATEVAIPDSGATPAAAIIPKKK